MLKWYLTHSLDRRARVPALFVRNCSFSVVRGWLERSPDDQIEWMWLTGNNPPLPLLCAVNKLDFSPSNYISCRLNSSPFLLSHILLDPLKPTYTTSIGENSSSWERCVTLNRFSSSHTNTIRQESLNSLIYFFDFRDRLVKKLKVSWSQMAFFNVCSHPWKPCRNERSVSPPTQRFRPERESDCARLVITVHMLVSGKPLKQ